MKSIRARLLVGLMLGTCLCCLVAAVLAFIIADTETDARSDARLRQIASTVVLPVPREVAWPMLADDLADAVSLQVWDGAATVYGIGPGQHLGLLTSEGFVTADVNGVRWRAYAAMRDGVIVQALQPIAVRQRQAAHMALRIALPFAFLLPALGLLIWVAVGRALRPIVQLADEVGARVPTALGALSADGMPPELTPIVGALNGLLHQIDHAMARQRDFVADAAHELRSPLTALKIELQSVRPADAAAGTQYQRIAARVDRAIHMVNQLLALARHEPGAARPSGVAAPCDLAHLACMVVADHAAEAEAREIDLGMMADSLPATAVIVRDAVNVALRNLVDNALRYTPRGGRVDVACGYAGAKPYIRVADNGPGIAGADRARVLDRFYRVAGTSAPGCGLGLAIVHSVAQSHGAELILDDTPGGGLVVTILFR